MKTHSVYIDKIKSSITFLVGGCAEENVQLIDLSHPYDLWFHINGRPSCHVVTQLQEEPTWTRKERGYVVRQGALLCKQMSKYKTDKNVPIVFTTIENVEKTDIVGSVVTKNCGHITV
jgi:predicted ribosome quality control (RQC) complex YloA/Tae2 family protein